MPQHARGARRAPPASDTLRAARREAFSSLLMMPIFIFDTPIADIFHVDCH